MLENIQGRYRHYKGKEYEVISTAKHSETGEIYIVYRACYGDQETWIRPKNMFLEMVQTAEGDEQPRFQKIIL